MSRLQGVDLKYGPACMLSYIQLHTWAFFVDVLNANTLVEAAAVPVPQFQACLRDMMVGDLSWLPMLPQCYYSITLPKVLDPKMETKTDNPNSKKKLAQVHNLNMSSHFNKFKTGITSNKCNDVIKKVGPPPKVKRKGKDVATCVSYHLRGTCFKGCNRKANHGPHSKDEDDAHYAWCQKAFA